jgi:hypothetical protein
MSWIMVGSTAVSVVGGAIARNQQNKGAQGAANAITDEQRRQYEQTRGDLSPYMDFGKQAIGGLGALNAGDYSGFMSSPDYLFASQQGIGNLDKSAASRGSLFSGGHEKDLAQFNQGLAGQFLGNYRNSLFDQAQMGQSAATNLGSFGANAADRIGNAQAGYLQQRGDNNADFIGGTASQLGSLFGRYMGQRAGSQPGGGGSSYNWASGNGFGNNYAPTGAFSGQNYTTPNYFGGSFMDGKL